MVSGTRCGCRVPRVQTVPPVCVCEKLTAGDADHLFSSASIQDIRQDNLDEYKWNLNDLNAAVGDAWDVEIYCSWMERRRDLSALPGKYLFPKKFSSESPSSHCNLCDSDR